MKTNVSWNTLYFRFFPDFRLNIGLAVGLSVFTHFLWVFTRSCCKKPAFLQLEIHHLRIYIFSISAESMITFLPFFAGKIRKIRHVPSQKSTSSPAWTTPKWAGVGRAAPRFHRGWHGAAHYGCRLRVCDTGGRGQEVVFFFLDPGMVVSL